MKMKTCEYCGENFEPRHHSQKYHQDCAIKKHKEQNKLWSEEHPERTREANKKQYAKTFSKEAVKERRKEIFCTITGMSRERYLQIKKDLGMV